MLQLAQHWETLEQSLRLLEDIYRDVSSGAMLQVIGGGGDAVPIYQWGAGAEDHAPEERGRSCSLIPKSRADSARSVSAGIE